MTFFNLIGCPSWPGGRRDIETEWDLPGTQCIFPYSLPADLFSFEMEIHSPPNSARIVVIDPPLADDDAPVETFSPCHRLSLPASSPRVWRRAWRRVLTMQLLTLVHHERTPLPLYHPLPAPVSVITCMLTLPDSVYRSDLSSSGEWPQFCLHQIIDRLWTWLKTLIRRW